MESEGPHGLGGHAGDSECPVAHTGEQGLEDLMDQTRPGVQTGESQSAGTSSPGVNRRSQTSRKDQPQLAETRTGGPVTKQDEHMSAEVREGAEDSPDQGPPTAMLEERGWPRPAAARGRVSEKGSMGREMWPCLGVWPSTRSRETALHGQRWVVCNTVTWTAS